MNVFSRLALVYLVGSLLSGSVFADDKKATEFFENYSPKTNGAKLYYPRLKNSMKKEDAEFREILGELFLAAEQAVKDAPEEDKASIKKDAIEGIEIWSFKYGQHAKDKKVAASFLHRILKGFKGEKDEGKPVVAIRGLREAMSMDPKNLPTSLVDEFHGKKE